MAEAGQRTDVETPCEEELGEVTEERDQLLQEVQAAHAEKIAIAPGLACHCKWCDPEAEEG